MDNARASTHGAAREGAAAPAAGSTAAQKAAERTSVGSGGSGVMGQVKDRAVRELSSQKGRATGELDAVAQAVRDASARLRNEHHDTVAAYVERAAGGLERFSQTLRDKDPSDLLRDAQRLARRQPAAFIGGSFAFGLLAARFLKSSSQSEDEETSSEAGRRYWTGSGWQGGGAAFEDQRGGA